MREIVGKSDRIARGSSRTISRGAAAVRAVGQVGEELAERARLEREATDRHVTVRDLAHEWLAWLRDVKQIKPST